ncbi:uncharacterized protein NPIL_365021 [Nephila pilipes]|uniref:MADF domain-containing protein n=1 Tax=Nephila pilipes TaxID=299642 RepID=A0A8X6QQU1_NEPPI|nr:uncharacterized protein NPIL_365021 [Nephila pilipes]
MFDIEKFINEIKRRPALFDITLRDYNNRGVKIGCWTEIGSIMLPEWKSYTYIERIKQAKELTRKWKCIRDNFVKYYRTHTQKKGRRVVASKRCCRYYNQLQFLIPFIREARDWAYPSEFHNYDIPDDGGINIDDVKQELEVVTEEDTTVDKEQLSDTECDVTPNIPGRKSSPNALETIARVAETSSSSHSRSYSEVMSENGKKVTDKYGNRAFLLSFHPVMDSLPPSLYLEARMKIAKIFQEMSKYRNVNFNYPSSDEQSS